ncbi:hypothetical protein ACK1KB_13680 [Chryseobacterium sp. TY3]
MERAFEIYHVKPKETLQQIAERFEMDAEELKTFHHLHYKAAGLRWFGNFVAVEKIAVPYNFKTKSQREKEHHANFPSKTFNKNFYEKSYLVKEKLAGKRSEELEFEYTADIELTEGNGQIIASISTKNFLKNGNVPDDKISANSLACLEAINPVSFMLNQNGKPLQLANPEVYAKRFADKRKDMEDFMVGKVSSDYFDKFQGILKNPDLIFRKFNSQLLFQLLFPGMGWFHKNGQWQEEKVLVTNSFPVKMKFSASYQHEETGFAETKISGTIAEQWELQDILVNKKRTESVENPAEAVLQQTYFTDKEKKTLHSAEANITLFSNGNAYTSHMLKVSTKEL